MDITGWMRYAPYIYKLTDRKNNFIINTEIADKFDKRGIFLLLYHILQNFLHTFARCIWKRRSSESANGSQKLSQQNINGLMKLRQPQWASREHNENNNL